MLKKYVPSAVVLFFALAILSITIKQTAVGARPSLAAAKAKFSVSPSPTATVTPRPKVSYFLVYPGILPDSPLYQLKMIRDRVWLWLTTGSLEKANLFLLYADKRVGAGKALIEGNKVELGLSTILKGEKYLEKAAAEAEKAKKEGKKVEALIGKLKTASLKHEEMLLELKEKVSSEGKSTFDDLLKFVIALQQRIEKI